ncbi:hypothetical protein PgNI_10619 [Pyricularia grisea]|uniref:Hydrolase pyiE n=2 Tax=Pyricularia grisea TaxID=148305 RepID=PYIE_PYRGI|nr:hypothetical protein PgNI_10619 [Pyricularia grisea]A0A4P8W7Y2.1 RecName: Full=Hydrolase pyiE; AltName: Full=Pyrichalasin H biosynthesis cluster protein E [Pyricularia grisea]QCS37512.1 PyiE [Pyricularia grisea]TLD07195.1 hypothetical protein PgNI_10619 [Pyricularia grisea]
MHKFFPRSGFFDFETVRILGTACYGGADVAEVLEAVGEIKSDDAASWEEAWRRQSWWAEALADQAREGGDREAARRAYLRASNYARASGYMYVSDLGAEGGNAPPTQDPRALPVAEKVGRLFRKALALMEGEVRALSIPCGAQALPGLLYLPPPGKRIPGRDKIPVLVFLGGADSCQEELYYLYPAAGPGLGYAVLTFDGPGQGIVLRKHGLRVRPDWEVVTSSVLDYLEAYSAQHPGLELDMKAIAVSGASMGGYYALRSAVDRRVKACVSIDPFYDMWDFGTAHVSPLFISAWTSGIISSGFVDKLMTVVSRLWFQMKWEIALTGTLFGLSSPSQILLNMKNYTLSGKSDGSRANGKKSHSPTDGGGVESDSFLSEVRCPVFLSGAGKSLYLDVDSHTRRCYDGLTGVAAKDKELWVPESEGQGSLQAKMGALALCNQKTFQFLDKVLGVQRVPLDVSAHI